MAELNCLKPSLPSTSRRYYWFNLAGISLGIPCLLVGYNILLFLQSSLHSKGGLGTIALATDYASQVLTCICLPPFFMRTIGCKWTLVVSGVCHVIFIVANLKASFVTLIPASVIMGIGSSLMWATMNTVVSDLATGYARLTGSSEATILSQFFSIFFSLVNSSAIWSNLISAQILSPQEMFTDDNASLSETVCGAKYCSSNEISTNSPNSSSNVKEVPQSEVNSLVIAGLIAVDLGIVVIVIFLSSYNEKVRESTESALSRLLATIRFCRNTNLLLLVICTCNSGLMFSFLIADMSKAFVTCSIGIHNVGWVHMCGGTVATVGTIILIFLTRFIPRIALFLGAVVINLVVLVLLLVWVPDPQTPIVFFVISGIWGLTYVVWFSQLMALYGDVFMDNHQEAYSSERILDCIGLAIGYAWSHYLCVYIKIYIILGCLLTGAAGYLAVERRLFTSRKWKYDVKTKATVTHCTLRNFL